ncbi:outer membrane protein [Geobacter sp. AOG1]|uniref:outer membrane protein n=1 Tax=Geobacter sp. AOG1 TaxID=1566346 RepID=UPI001CC4B7A9|nr:outer membrane beta-barrel protein [Geobacter sp. AOG1]GFE58845.1 outer membrane channel protein [Geobacter sp. AOG1]
MKNLVMVLVGVLVLASSSMVFAAGRAYVGGSVGAFIPQDSHVTFNDGTQEQESFNTGYVITGFGGYAFDSGLRVEGELAYREAEFDKGTDTFGNRVNLHGSLWAFSGMANLFYDIRTTTNVTPYLGGGIGFATVGHDSDWGYGYNQYYGYYYRDSEDKTVFAYQAGGGLNIDLNRVMALDVGYRYFATENVHFDFREMDLASHNVTVGVKFKF